MSKTKSIQAMPLTDQSWILLEWGNRLGLLSNSGSAVKLITSASSEQFDSVDSMCAVKQWTIKFEKPAEKEEKETQKINHLPIKHSEAHDVELTPLISYAKQQGSSVRFAAGYWALRFSHAWTAAFCPKLTTLQEYDHVGPFSSKLELNTILAQKNRDINKSSPLSKEQQ